MFRETRIAPTFPPAQSQGRAVARPRGVGGGEGGKVRDPRRGSSALFFFFFLVFTCEFLFFHGFRKVEALSEMAEATDRPTARPTDRQQRTEVDRQLHHILLHEFPATSMCYIRYFFDAGFSSTYVRGHLY